MRHYITSNPLKQTTKYCFWQSQYHSATVIINASIVLRAISLPSMESSRMAHKFLISLFWLNAHSGYSLHPISPSLSHYYVYIFFVMRLKFSFSLHVKVYEMISLSHMIKCWHLWFSHNGITCLMPLHRQNLTYTIPNTYSHLQQTWLVKLSNIQISWICHMNFLDMYFLFVRCEIDPFEIYFFLLSFNVRRV